MQQPCQHLCWAKLPIRYSDRRVLENGSTWLCGGVFPGQSVGSFLRVLVTERNRRCRAPLPASGYPASTPHRDTAKETQGY